MTTTSLNNGAVLALLGLDDAAHFRLALIESSGVSTVFAAPPQWHPSAASRLDIPYRVMGTVANAPVHCSVLKVLLERMWKHQGGQVPGVPGWFNVSNVKFEADVSDLLARLTNPQAVKALVADMTREGRNLTLLRGGSELWATAGILWAFSDPTDTEQSPAEMALDGFFADLRANPGQAARPEERAVLEQFQALAKSTGSVAVERWEVLYQDILGNERPRDDAFTSYLAVLSQHFEREVNLGRLETECKGLLVLLKDLKFSRDEDCTELSSSLPLGLREALVRLAEVTHESDALFLIWLKKQLLPSLLHDPVHRRRIYGGMAVCSLVVLYISPGTFVVMSLLAAIGYYSVKRRG